MSESGGAGPADPGPGAIILDTGPAVALARLAYVDGLLSQPDFRLVLPRPVAHELDAKPDAAGAELARRIPISETAADELASIWQPGSGPALGAGELAVILVAERLRNRRPRSSVVAIIDDRDAWRFAARRWGESDELTGTLGLLYLIHERGLQKRTLTVDVARLRAGGYRFSEAEVEHFLRSATRALGAVREAGQPASELWLKRMRTAGLQRSASRRSRSRRSEHSIGDDPGRTSPAER